MINQIDNNMQGLMALYWQNINKTAPDAHRFIDTDDDKMPADTFDRNKNLK